MLTVCVSTHYGTFVLPLSHFLAHLPLITFDPNDPNAHFPIHSQPPNFQPSFTAPTEELARMKARAGEVIRLLEVLRNDTHLPLLLPLLRIHILIRLTQSQCARSMA